MAGFPHLPIQPLQDFGPARCTLGDDSVINRQKLIEPLPVNPSRLASSSQRLEPRAFHAFVERVS